MCIRDRSRAAPLPREVQDACALVDSNWPARDVRRGAFQAALRARCRGPAPRRFRARSKMRARSSTLTGRRATCAALHSKRRSVRARE
eukprot:461351-Alexandrium_andersonii.AAC.1